jgi:hypothetical protein
VQKRLIAAIEYARHAPTDDRIPIDDAGIINVTKVADQPSFDLAWSCSNLYSPTDQLPALQGLIDENQGKFWAFPHASHVLVIPIAESESFLNEICPQLHLPPQVHELYFFVEEAKAERFVQLERPDSSATRA